MKPQDICAICVAAVALSAATYVLLEVQEEADVSTMSPCIGNNGILNPGSTWNISNYTACQPEQMIKLAQCLTRGQLRALVINQRRVGLWADLVWVGTPICAMHIYDAMEFWGGYGRAPVTQLRGEPTKPKPGGRYTRNF